MSLIVKRALEKQAMQRREPDDLSAQNLLDALYEMIDSGKIHKDARIVINNDMWCLFMCSNCGKQNTKEYRNTILKFEILESDSSHTTLQIFTLKRK